jgi:hypothetical protein
MVAWLREPGEGFSVTEPDHPYPASYGFVSSIGLHILLVCVHYQDRDSTDRVLHEALTTTYWPLTLADMDYACSWES